MGESAEPAAIVMAAGKSTRMKSDHPKVLHELCGQPLLAYVLNALEDAGIKRRIVVVGFRAELVMDRFRHEPGVEFVLQEEQKGTGHAVACCREALGGHAGPIFVLAGDGPMIRAEMLAEMLKRRQETGAAAFLATAHVGDPTGLGRIIRDKDGHFLRIVEQKDAGPEEAAVREINPSFYCFDGGLLFEALEQVTPNNAQGEYYVTDAPAILLQGGRKVIAEPLADETDMFGVNSRRHLALGHVLMQQRIHEKLMDHGVTIVDSRNTYIDARAQIGKDTVILPFSVIGGPTVIGRNCTIGPFSHIREYTTIADGVQVGAFVEIVRSELGDRCVVKHLSYLGDATLGDAVNVGAGVITANYDGRQKHRTTIDDEAFLGSGAVIVPPVEIGGKAVIGAGAVLTKRHDVRPGEMVVGVPARPMKPRES